jgi:[ribosomal protein S5]-alanine N-acetyltransferase
MENKIVLRPIDLDLLSAIQGGKRDMQEKIGAILPDDYTEFPDSFQYLYNSLKKNELILPFTSYSIFLSDPLTYIGQCGFVHAPDEQGSTEIGYEICKAYRGHGYADQSIKQLIKIAFESTQVNQIVAHTLGTQNASNHLLIKNHFVYDKTIFNTEDGNIWKWVLNKKVYQIKEFFL